MSKTRSWRRRAAECGIPRRVRHPRSAVIVSPLLESVLRDDMQAVDRVLRESLASDVALIRQVAEYIVGGGGKRLRPALLLLAAQACGYRGTHHYTLAAVVEMIHTATLLHDDVVDESSLRRGHATANAMFGNAASVLVGDFLYSRAFQLMVTVDSMRVLRILSDATNVIAEGEVLQLMNCRQPGRRRRRLPRRHPAQDGEALRGRRRGSARCWPERDAAIEEALRALRHASRHRVPVDRRRARLLGRLTTRSARTSATISPKASRRCR